MTNEAADILRKAKELIETKGWCQRTYAIDRYGNPSFNPRLDCTAFCLSGALIALIGRDYQNQPRQLLQKVVGHTDLSFWNDRKCKSKKEALSAFDRAIALAEAGNA